MYLVNANATKGLSARRRPECRGRSQLRDLGDQRYRRLFRQHCGAVSQHAGRQRHLQHHHVRRRCRQRHGHRQLTAGAAELSRSATSGRALLRRPRPARSHPGTPGANVANWYSASLSPTVVSVSTTPVGELADRRRRRDRARVRRPRHRRERFSGSGSSGDAASAPLSSIPLSSIALASSPLHSIPLSSIPLSSIALPGSGDQRRSRLRNRPSRAPCCPTSAITYEPAGCTTSDVRGMERGPRRQPVRRAPARVGDARGRPSGHDRR